MERGRGTQSRRSAPAASAEPNAQRQAGGSERSERRVRRGDIRDALEQDILTGRSRPGEKLDEQQLAKLGRLDSTLAELEALLTGG